MKTKHIISVSILLATLSSNVHGQDLSDIHKNHMNEVIFSSEEIKLGETDTTKFKREFNGLEPIYLNFYWDKPIAEYKIIETKSFRYNGLPETNPFNENGEFLVEFIVVDETQDKGLKKNAPKKKGKLARVIAAAGGVEIIVRPDTYNDFNRLLEVSMTKENANILTFDFSLNTGAEKDVYKTITQWARLYNKLEPGRHKIRVTMRANHPVRLHRTDEDNVDHYLGEEYICSGEFYLTKNKGELIKTGKLFENSVTIGMEDPVLEANILKLIKKERDSESSVFLADKIYSKDWTITRNDLTGVILGRKITAWLLIKTFKTGLCKYRPYVFFQEYNGSGFGNTLYIEGTLNSNDDNRCDCPE